MVRSRVGAGVIVLTGFACALIIYLTAAEAPSDPFAEFEKSKRFFSELGRMGGKAAIAAHDFNRWFAGLWHGETFAFTVAVITLIAAGGYYFIASGLEAEAGREEEESRGSSSG